MDATFARIWELAAPLAQTQGLEIIDIELRPEGSRGGRVLRLYLDKDGGPNMEELSQVSRELGALLDEHDIVEGAYTLEVSSPDAQIARAFQAIYRQTGARAHAGVDPRPSIVFGSAARCLDGPDYGESRWDAFRDPVRDNRKIELRARLECGICSRI
jgi:hypothetical protein